MAAPILSTSSQQGTLKKLSSKESAAKKTLKNLLCIGPNEWPRPPKDVEDQILSKLSERLKTLPNLFKSTKSSSDEDRCMKIKVRSQLAIGTSSVFRALEQDKLACVLISGQATPAIAVDHIIALGKERGCSLLCLDQLSSTLAQVTESKCLPLAVGFRKMQEGMETNFADVVSIIVDNAPVSAPLVAASDTTNTPSERVEAVNFKVNKFRPLRIAAETGKEILGELKKLFTQAVIGERADQRKDVNRQKKKKKQRKKKRNLKDAFEKSYHGQFEVGKRTVTDILDRGKLQLIVVSEEIVPFLMSELQSYSLLSIAAEKNCPVLVLPGLLDTMQTICSASMSVMGFKKQSALPPDCHYSFQPVIQMCMHALSDLGDSNGHSPSSKTARVEGNSDLEVIGGKVPDVVLSEMSTKEMEQEEDCKEDEDEEEDYSYLYVLKKDSKELAEIKTRRKEEVESTSKSSSLTADFISFTSASGEKDVNKAKSEVKNSASDLMLGIPSHSASSRASPSGSRNEESLKLQGADFLAFSSPTTDCGAGGDSLLKNGVPEYAYLPGKASPFLSFSISRSGNQDQSFQKNVAGVTDKNKGNGKANVANQIIDDGRVLGLKEAVAAKDTVIDFLTLAEPSNRSAKKAIKRKIQADDSFISFTYTETNIRTMTSNPSKKRKKKTKKKK